MAERKPKEYTVAELVDEIGDLDRELSPIKPKIKRDDDLRKELRRRYDDTPAALESKAEGERFVINVGERKFQSVVNLPKLFKSVTWKVFLKIISATKSAIEEHCSPDVAKSVLSEKQTGYRPLDITAKGTAPEA